MQNFLNLVIKTSIYLLVFLLPIFFLPFSFEAFEYSKQYLLFFLVSLGFFCWISKMVIYEKAIRFRLSPLDYFVLGFLLVAVLSAIFSVDKDSSIYGFYGRFSNGLIGLLSLGALYFLITNNVSLSGKPLINADKKPITTDKKSAEISHKSVLIDGILKVFLGSSVLVVLAGYFSIFKVWAKIDSLWHLPKVMLQSTFNPAAGSLEGLSIFLAVVVVLVAGLLLFRIRNFFYWLLLMASLGLMVIVDFTAAWIVLSVTLLLFVGFSMAKRIFKENVNRLLISILLIIVAAVLIPFQPQNLNLPKEQVLSQQISWEVAVKSATDNVRAGFLGSGIGTFHYDFAKQKPQEINQTWLWQIRFDRAGNHFAEILGTMGFLGILFYLGLIGMFLLISWFLLSRQFAGIPLLLAFVALLVGQFVYPQNTILAFMFWLTLGLSVVKGEEKIKSFKDFPELSLIFSTLIIVLGVAILAVYFYAGKFYLADMNYNKALQILGEERVKILEKTIRLNPYSPRYRVALAGTHLYEAVIEMQKPGGQQDASKIQTSVAKAVDEAKMATLLQPNSVANWETLGVIYREIAGVAAGAVDWGIKSFEKATELEPTNPVLYTELGKLYAVKGDTEKAKEYFGKALSKKSDYSDALIQEALLLEREEVLDEAIKKLEDFVRVDPFNIEALFQLGRLYFNGGRIQEATGLFQRVVILVPNHSNARYSLGVAYAAQGEKELAIEQFERVLELNPGNPDVIQKLNQLRSEK